MIKLKLMPLLAGAITSLSFANALVVAAPQAVKAEPNQPTQIKQTAPNQAPSQAQIAGVEITPQQQDQLAKLSSDTRTQIEAVLTPPQREQLKVAMQSRQAPQTTFSNMKLSAQQQNQLQGIMQSAQARAEAILTPEQRQKIQQNLQQRQQQQQPNPQQQSPQQGK